MSSKLTIFRMSLNECNAMVDERHSLTPARTMRPSLSPRAFCCACSWRRIKTGASIWPTCTGSKAHLKKLAAVTEPLRDLKREGFASEKSLYRHFGLQYMEPELREGHDEVERAKAGTLPRLVTAKDIRGELHAHSLSSDGVDSIEDMAEAARERGYEYIGITDHSQSLKIAGGVSVDDLWQQIRYIDKLNGKLRGFRILKSSEVDILADGSLDYPDDLLKELDYTVCSIHSRFALDKKAQTERLLRAMDNRYFNILGHATGRLLLKRPGYEIDIERVIDQARQNGCFFEINSSPDRLGSVRGQRTQGGCGGSDDRRLNRFSQYGRTRSCPVRTRSGAAGWSAKSRRS